jgi:uncharacterized protein (TIGR00661 family)
MAPRQYLIACFFEAPTRETAKSIRWTLPLLRDEVVELQPRAGDHVVAYQGYSTFPAFTETLGRVGRPVHVYGMGARPAEGRIRFKAFDEAELLDDLAGCAYVICGGGHTLISEALHLGKPVLSIPVGGHFEQFMNAFYIERCGFGRRAHPRKFSADLVREFEQELDGFRHRIAQRVSRGNGPVFAALGDFLSGRWR